jgi:lysophospholipase L1-like esterase
VTPSPPEKRGAWLDKKTWAVAPTFLCLLGFWLVYADDGLTALADRTTVKTRPHGAAPAMPGMAPQPEVAEADTEADLDADDDADDTASGGGGSASASSAAARAAAKVAHLEDVCVDGDAAACKRWAMDGFYGAVAASRAGSLGRAVRVSYYGDSVISTDAVPARVRTRLQKELGDGGPGWVWLVFPHRFVRHEVVKIGNGGDWDSWAAPTKPVGDGLHGVGGATAETWDGTATLTSKRAFTDVELYYLGQPKGGTVDLVLDGAALGTVDTAREAKESAFDRHRATTAGTKLQVKTHGKVRVFGLTLENASGAVVDNMGLVSATVKNLAHNNPDHFAKQLAHRAADLVIIMVGANEAEWLPAGKTAMAEYRANYELILAPIRKGLPQSTCLVVSPLDQGHTNAAGDLASRPVMPMLVAAQRAAAKAQGCAFFSAYDWQGGKGSSVAWHAKRLVGDDFQHLSRKGANKLADALVDALLGGAKDFAAR